MLIERDDAVLVIVDVQGKLAHSMFRKDELFTSLEILIRGCQILELPILLTEQVPEKLGPTVEEVSTLLTGCTPIAKRHFSCARDQDFMKALSETGKTAVILAGIEAHVCVYQTAADLIEAGFRIEVVGDAVSSRIEANRKVGLAKMQSLGAHLTSTEMLLFELMKIAQGESFRQLVRIVK
jgi:nicotinamidase-related amidase